MKRQVVLFTALMLGIFFLYACAAATPAPTPAPDMADCSNLPAGAPKIKIEGSWANATNGGDTAGSTQGMGSEMPMGSSIKTAAFMVIHNCGTEADTLVKAMSNLEGMTKLMNFEMKDGKSTMMDISQIEIPAGKKVILKSGGYHVMFMNLKQDLKPGDPVELTLTFKNAGDIKVSPIVKGP